MQCPHCGFSMREGEAVCPQCGDNQAPSAVIDAPSSFEPSRVPAGDAEGVAPVAEIPHEDVAPGPQPYTAPAGASGPPFCTCCGSRLSPGGSFCPLCGAKQSFAVPGEEMVPVSPVYYPPQEDYDTPLPQPKKGGGKKIGLIAATATALVAVVIVALIQQFSPILGGSIQSAESPIVYVQDGNSLKYKTSAMEKAEVVTGGFDLASDLEWESTYLSTVSMDGKYLLYLNDYRYKDYSDDGRGDLYLRDISKPAEAGAPSDKGTKIASDVTLNFYFSDDGQYVFYINYSGELFAWDYSESCKIDSDVEGILDWNGDKILYYKGNPADSYASSFVKQDVYLAPFFNDRESRLKIDTDINQVVDWCDSLEKFLYTKPASGSRDSGASFDLYAYDAASDGREKLLSEIGEVVEGDAEARSAVYLVSQSSGMSIGSILDDDMAKADALLQPPDITEYPAFVQALEEAFGVYTFDYLFDYTEDLDLEDLEMLEYLLSMYGSGYDMNAQGLKAELDTLKKELSEYAAKAMRDDLRERIAGQAEQTSVVSDFLFNDLYLLRDGERVKLDSNVVQSSYYSSGLSVLSDMEMGYVAYLKRDLSEIEKIKMSEMADAGYSFTFDLDDFLEDRLYGELYYTPLDGSPALLDTETEDFALFPGSIAIHGELEGIYYLRENRDTGYDAEQYLSNDYDDSTPSSDMDLYYVPVDGKLALGESQLVDEGVNYLYSKRYKDEKILYVKNRKGDKCDLYTAAGIQTERLCYDVSYSAYSGVIGDDQTLYFFENYSEDREIGDFYIMNQDKIKVSENTYDFFYRNDNLIYVLQDYRNGKGDLYVFNGDSLTLVDYDVTTVLGEA